MTDIDLFVMAGQSNAMGASPDSGPAVPGGMGYEWTKPGALDHLADPVGPASVGSAWPAFANAVIDYTERPVCVASSAVSGAALLASAALGESGLWSGGDWSETGSRYDNCIARTDACIAALETAGFTVTLAGVVWHQGERDAQAGISQATYQAALVALHERFKTSLSDSALKFFVIRVGRLGSGDTVGWQHIRDAQDAACAAQDGMEMAYTGCVDFPDLGYMQADGLHYTQVGYDLMGTEAGTFTTAFLAPPSGGGGGGGGGLTTGHNSGVGRRLLFV